MTLPDPNSESQELAKLKQMAASDPLLAARLDSAASAAEIREIAASVGIALTEPQPASGGLSESELNGAFGGWCTSR